KADAIQVVIGQDVVVADKDLRGGVNRQFVRQVRVNQTRFFGVGGEKYHRVSYAGDIREHGWIVVVFDLAQNASVRAGPFFLKSRLQTLGQLRVGGDDDGLMQAMLLGQLCDL